MTGRERVLLAFAVFGFFFANTMVAIFTIRHGAPLGEYFRHWFEYLPAAQITIDIGLVFIVFCLWAAWEGQRLGMRSWWTIPGCLLIGVCFAFPLFLFLRERELRKRRAPGYVEVDAAAGSAGSRPTATSPAAPAQR